MTVLGEKLKQLRTQRQLSQREVARALGLNHTRWRDFEVGVVHGTTRPAIPSRDQIQRIADLFDYPADILLRLGGHPVVQPPPVVKPTEEDAALREIEDIFRRLPRELQSVLLDIVRAFRKTIA